MGKNMVTKGEEEHDKQTLMTQPADAKGARTNKETKETERRQRQIATAGNERVGLHTVAKGVGGWVGGGEARGQLKTTREGGRVALEQRVRWRAPRASRMERLCGGRGA